MEANHKGDIHIHNVTQTNHSHELNHPVMKGDKMTPGDARIRMIAAVSRIENDSNYFNRTGKTTQHADVWCLG